jgi:hypothetical protein
MAMRMDKELQEFRDLLRPPDTFEDGFNWRTLIMALFVGLIMAPAQMYMGLVAGMGMGGAAQWVTVILYVEIARRAFTKIRRPELFVLFYMCGAVMSADAGLLWRQFIVQSESVRMLGLTDHIPQWYAPSDPHVLAQRSFFLKAWLVPIALTIGLSLIQRLDSFGLGYVMYRLTSDVEKLPFPMAPVGAAGMTALADVSNDRDTWRWRTFAVGAMVGIVWGLVYIGIPQITGAVFSAPISIIPIPFADITSYTERILPGVPFPVMFDLSLLITGMVMPFYAVVGSFIAMLFMLLFNPLLYHLGYLPNWEPGLGAIQTMQSNSMDYFMSFGLGLQFAVAAIGIAACVRSFRAKRVELAEAGLGKVEWSRLFRPPEGRGDIPIWVALGIYLFSTCVYMGAAYYLVNYCSGPLAGCKFPLWLLAFYGFLYTPVMSYVQSRMEGLVGQQFPVPFVREVTFILSGYKGAAIWFAPIPLQNYAGQVMFFRTTELTGTRFRSIIKAELLLFPIVTVGMLLFAQFLWSMGNVPGAMFPYANKYWELSAFNQALTWTATMPNAGQSAFQQAFHPGVLALGFGLATSLYGVLSHFGLPIMLVFGLVRGLDSSLPGSIVPMMVGALIGRYILAKRYGENWPQIRIVFAAGVAAGIGLVTLLGLGFVLMSKSVIKLVL